MSLKNFASKNQGYAGENDDKSCNFNNQTTKNLKDSMPKDIYEKNHKTAEEIYNEYKDYSKDELTSMLYKQVENEKQKGTFNFQKIESSINMILPYVNDTQKQNLKNLLEKIR